MSYPEPILASAGGAAEGVREALDKAAEAISQARGGFEQLMSGESMVAAVDPFVFQLTTFVMAVLVGYYVVWSVTAALHTPLMSITNAISSVIVVGAVVAVGADLPFSSEMFLARGFGFVALILAMVNIFGGFWVTNRMLAMYRKKG